MKSFMSFNMKFYSMCIPSRHFVKAVSSQPDRGDLSAIDGAVEVIFFDFDGTLTESHRHDFCSVPGLSPNKGHSRNDRSGFLWAHNKQVVYPVCFKKSYQHEPIWSKCITCESLTLI